ncbi:50S ribosomal protein L1 [Candidatus Desantisbacteria bacterium CG2_30_40_21]|uniref:Large ribosomal subunit protein uL1 n=5 Tax=unclassified Candidatus Desantisiibacteriota TaxID=3106372 RepID=A0A2M7JF45_9BACT|nr:MAG: 50S ribosomal protein L1 [Candidatus Desantisbacteria bacterium CG2_30_40_21]PIP41887.1 MAG: 50S ribosomal protein L1 [Candidatus Desantisbacteria bacterium CG23_combo_of_CG06-09_8_20_14_all_40_23]PIX18034.1 MAG: 50S ribosomal protein L1 [Candidatus Desantisbacteria bacterium CG_4_8_14_3_um_filter_40_12]PIY19646.1 MAG: 50S ribosomal protein L1 [Candidatus Desantisbacteria bacterium CG_4_10_14_3_um_filter_40_18]PJB29469.1 MAG: 50S ribosomal protein L1 [Candidatus Desantisbacteria bacteri
MSKISKKFGQAMGLIDKTKVYEVDEALELAKATSFVKFDESVDVSIKLGVNPKHAGQQVRSTVVLPHGTGKKVRIAVFAKGEKALEAEQAGADIVGEKDLIDKIKEGFLDFDVSIATPDMMKDVGQLGKVLGPRGLMPNPKSGTVTMDIAKAVNEVRNGKVEFRCDSFGIVHSSIGKVSFDMGKLHDNFKAFFMAILKAKPQTVKGQYVRGIDISTTMGPGIKIDSRVAKKIVEE